MRIGRWLGLVAIAPGFVLVLVVLFFAGDLVGLKDTPAIRAALLGTAGLAALTGWLLAAWKPVPHAVWSLPAGAGFAVSIWIAIRPVGGLSIPAAVIVTIASVAALVAISVLAATLARRSPAAAVLVAITGVVLLVVLLPFLAVRLGAGPAIAPWSSMTTWTAAGLTDDTFGGDVPRRNAAQIAGAVAILVMIASSYVLGYVISLRRPRLDEAIAV
jgi:hypothetical protein